MLLTESFALRTDPSDSRPARRAIVTGASKGIGRAIAADLANRGYLVIAAARSADLLDTLARDRDGAEGGVVIHPCDLREMDAAQACVDAALATFGGLDLIVHSAGATKRGDFFSLTPEDFVDGFALKFHAAVNMARAAWPHLRASGHGHIINVIGVGGWTPSADFTIGGPVNSALMNFTKAMADRGLGEGVRVNGINPGPIETDRLRARFAVAQAESGLSEAAIREQMLVHERVTRFGRPNEIATLVAFLDSADGAYFHGALIDLDGGARKGI
ncbi:SDR family oxidoreductase [Aurantimonas sp. A2-1-M11]|uniref:SDR family oxidoreductase n=1 Tax=Aurantimonas sp. A2-1-M11 TaxID=3113712 RepID=UPI002F95D743